VGCDKWIASVPAPNDEAGIVLDRIGLPQGRYPWRLAKTRDRQFRFWGKWNAFVRAGTGEPVTISIARPWRRHAVIEWGNGRALSVEFLPCAGDEPWFAYAGGFSLKKRGCVPFDVQSGRRIQRIRIGFGRPCLA
jgi:hypothetical protein